MIACHIHCRVPIFFLGSNIKQFFLHFFKEKLWNYCHDSLMGIGVD